MTVLRSLGDIETALLRGKPRQRFVIPEVLPTGPCFLYGQSGSGKTGIAIRTALSVAAGLPWAGHRVEPGAVIYIAGEDYLGVEERLVAGAQALGLAAAEVPLFLIEPPQGGLVHKTFADEVQRVASAVQAEANLSVSLIVIDTLGACFGDESQDDARYGTRATGTLERLSRELNCAVLVLHHPGKRSDGMRGSQVLKDRADAVIKAWRSASGATMLEVEKMRNQRDGARFTFAIDVEELVTAESSFPIQVVKEVRIAEPGAAQTREEARAQHRHTDAATAMGILMRIARDGQATRKVWQAECFKAWAAKPSEGARKTAFTNAVKKLREDGSVTVQGDLVSVSVSVSKLHTLAA